LSEYLNPGAELEMEWEGETQCWVVQDVAEVQRAE
jgi:hypothetical protein